ncbi:hypothetical protein MMC07_006563 [Pseudocyphellaria aurata]|nr:hypothetical protein [Pseudocyphellaria aurata]
MKRAAAAALFGIISPLPPRCDAVAFAGAAGLDLAAAPNLGLLLKACNETPKKTAARLQANVQNLGRAIGQTIAFNRACGYSGLVRRDVLQRIRSERLGPVDIADDCSLAAQHDNMTTPLQDIVCSPEGSAHPSSAVHYSAPQRRVRALADRCDKVQLGRSMYRRDAPILSRERATSENDGKALALAKSNCCEAGMKFCDAERSGTSSV